MEDTHWVDRAKYPFATHWLDTEGGRMHYVDEGSGPPIMLVHGTPTWSFLYRRLIKELSGSYRCIAADLPGFGLSEKPEEYGYRPAEQARVLSRLIEHLGLRDLVLVVHDFGGPIGLSYAIKHPENVRALVLFNTWMWSLKGDRQYELGGKLMGGPVGRLLYTRMNFSPRVILRSAWAEKDKLTKEVHAQYLGPFPTPRDRRSTSVYARELLGSSDWYEGLWNRRDRIANLPALILWGEKDSAFGKQLPRWRELLPHAEVHTFPNAGHFVPEEVDGVSAQVSAFLARVEQANAHDTGSRP